MNYNPLKYVCSCCQNVMCEECRCDRGDLTTENMDAIEEILAAEDNDPTAEMCSGTYRQRRQPKGARRKRGKQPASRRQRGGKAKKRKSTRSVAKRGGKRVKRERS